MGVRFRLAALTLPVVLLAAAAGAEEFELVEFRTRPLTGAYYSEGVGVGDVNGDGANDVVYGPYWFAGPEFEQKHEIFPPVPQPTERYADHFFSWLHDFDRDGRQDILVVGFPGTPAYVYHNPGPEQLDKHWPRRQVLDWVSNESPQFVDLVGDERPELVCTRDGFYGYATIDSQDPLGGWTFHAVSQPQAAAPRFGHGLGVGDVDGDGRSDIIASNGWFRQPRELGGRWPFHPAAFAPGGADMHAYDVDGDGLNDVITSLSAHNFGLAWHRQRREGGEIRFEQQLIMGAKPEDSRYGLVFSELHSVALADIDGDGLKDIITGKTFWSHHKQSPMWDAGAVVYWFRLVRGEDGQVDWKPFRAASDPGIGRQLVAKDIDGDGLIDLAAGGMKGAHVMIQSRRKVPEAKFRAAQPRPHVAMADGLSPQEAADKMTAPPGFQVQLAAGEPQVHQPVAMAYDHRGRLWVAEAHTYPVRAPEGQGQDKILVLEDTDGDGTLDSRQVFAEGLNLVSGLEVGFGGVFVGAAPYLLFLPDADGDDRADGEPQVLLDGFGYQDTHETLNAFIWGPDGWLYGCHGVFTHSLVGKPGTPDAQRTPLNAGVWRYHPLRHEFEVFARGTSNPWGVDFNDRGQAFVTACVIPHLWHVVQGARYQRQGGRHFNPHVYDDIKTIADHAHYVGNIRDHAWWGHEPNVPVSTSQAGGGHAHCGAMIYLGDNWPDVYRNRIYFNNIHGNRINCDLLEPLGSGFVGRHGKDLLLANDRWFRGINLRYGPDGAVHLIDWYDKNACHRRNPEVWDRTNGRIYRIAYGEVKPQPIDLSKRSDAELVELHRHKNQWHVRTARRLLQERRVGAATHALLGRLYADSALVEQKLAAAWTLHATGGWSEDWTLRLLDEDDPYLRGWAVQLELEDRQASDTVLQRLEQLAADDPSPVVRLYLAAALQRLPRPSRWTLAERLLARGEDADDHNLPLMLWYGIEPLAPDDPDRAMRIAAAGEIPLLRRYTIRRAAADDATVEHVVATLPEASDERAQLILEELVEAYSGRVDIPTPQSWSAAYEHLVESRSAAVRDLADQVAVALGDRRIFPRMRQLLADAEAPLEKRRQALQILVRGRDEAAAPALLAALETPPLRSASLRALAAFDAPEIAERLLAVYGELGEQERRDAVNTLSGRATFARRLLAAVADGRVPRTDLHAYNVRQMAALEDEALNEQIRESWGEVREASADKRQAIAQWKRRLTAESLAEADPGNGRRIFAQTCASCHRLFGEGGDIGPDITGSNRGNLDYILENVIDPSAVMGRDYRMTALRTEDGRALSGLVTKETDSAVTLQTINDQVVIPKSEILQRKLSQLSMMPDNLLEPLQADAVRDLIAYLGSPAQVPLRGRPAPIGPGGRVAGAIEGESLQVLEKSAGDARPQAMGSFQADRWSGDQLWWTGAKPGASLQLQFEVPRTADYVLEVVMTRARDYGVVQLAVDGRKLGPPVDLYDPQVVTTGVLEFLAGELAAGPHRLTVTIVGANPRADKAYMFGLDYLRPVARSE